MERGLCLALLLLAFALPLQAGTIETLTLAWGGADRTVRVHVPERWTPPRGLLVALHGGGGNPDQFAETTGLDGLSEEHGLLVAYPAGTGRTRKALTWNAGACCGHAARMGIDDVGFLAQVIDRLIATHAVDRGRVFMTGHSNGAQMTYRFLCERPGLVRAAIPVGAQPLRSCLPKDGPAASVLHIHGRNDPCALYEGGTCGGCFARVLAEIGLPSAGEGERWTCTPVSEAISAWAAAAGCEPEAHSGPEEPPLPGTANRLTWYGCREGATISLMTLEGGHPWPGGAPPAFCRSRPDGRLCRAWRGTVGPVPALDTSRIMSTFFASIGTHR